ncbi:MAG: serine hydrolase domain-containing protein, partial [Planctomycetota bacterium]
MRIIPSLLVITYFSQFVFAGHTEFEWKTASPESEGMSSEKLDATKDTLAAKGTKTLLVIRNDKIVYEWYASGLGPTKRHYTASLAKALVGGVSLMFALNDERLSIDEPACKYIPEWKGNPNKSKITIRHLATHSSGIEDAEQDEIPHFELPGWKGGFWKKDPDPFTLSRDKAPIIFLPGTQFAYSNPGMAMLSYAVTASLQGTKHTDMRTLLRERIMRPIGVKDDEWSVGYGQTYKVNGLNLVANWGGGSYTARAVARVGRLMLRKGNWQGKQLIESKCVEEVVKYAGTPLPDRPENGPNPGSGLGWWTNFDGVWTKVPRDAFGGAGAGNQVLLVVPSLDLIIVRNGSNLYNPSEGEGFWGGLEKYLFNPVIEAIIEPPYPRSSLIVKANFEPASSIVRKAKGSDNWPITWADDDNQYTAYGDGWGFEPKTKKKLSLGIAKITGSPPD